MILVVPVCKIRLGLRHPIGVEAVGEGRRIGPQGILLPLDVFGR